MKKHVFCRHNSEFEVQFFDVDSMDIMWHGHYVKYLEMARCQFLEEIGYTYDVMKKQGFGCPIVQLNINMLTRHYFVKKSELN